MIEHFANGVATTTLASALTSTATSCTVNSNTGLPAAAAGVSQFRVIIDSEIIIVTANSGTTWTISRGAEGTAAASHSSGTAVAHILTSAALNNIGLSPGGGTGQIYRKNSGTDYDDGWSDYLHHVSHQPGNPDDTLSHRGRANNTSMQSMDIGSCSGVFVPPSGYLILAHMPSYAAFTATQMGALQASGTAASGQTHCQFGMYSYNPDNIGTSAAAYTLLCSVADDPTMFTGTSSQNATSRNIRSLVAPSTYNFTYDQSLAWGFVSVYTTTGPQVRGGALHAGYSDTTGVYGPVHCRAVSGYTTLPASVAGNATFADPVVSLPFLGISV